MRNHPTTFSAAEWTFFGRGFIVQVHNALLCLSATQLRVSQKKEAFWAVPRPRASVVKIEDPHFFSAVFACIAKGQTNRGGFEPPAAFLEKR